MEPQRIDNKLYMTVDDNCGRRAYVDNHYGGLPIHIGQLKLAISEIQLLTEHPEVKHVVYAGAGGRYSGGRHVDALVDMFPEVHFWMWDPDGFATRNHTRVHKYPEYFTDAVAERIARDFDRVVFISDIRTVPNGRRHRHQPYDEEKWDTEVEQNMQDQRRWVEILVRADKLEIAMLKFRLPWDDGETMYLAGEVRFQAWAPANSTEARLVTDGRTVVSYRHRAYEEIMCWYNRDIRGGDYEHGVSPVDVPGVDRCHDCAMTVEVLRRYDRERVGYWFNRIMTTIGRSLSEGPHGKHADRPRAEREQLLAKDIAAYHVKRREKH